MILNTWPYSKKNLTIDSNSLVVLTYFELGKSGKLIHQDKISHPSYSLFKNLPMLSHGNHTIIGVEEIIEYLRKENFGLEYNLSESDAIKLKTLVGLVESNILPALNWFMWHENSAYSFTHEYYKESLNSYLNFCHLNRWKWNIIRKCKSSHLELCSYDNKTDQIISNILYERCRQSFVALSHILALNKFFLGETPTAADAYVFGRLAPFLIINLNMIQSNSDPHSLLTHLYGCTNLIEHSRRIQESCYPDAQAAFKTSLESILSKNKSTHSSWFKPGIRDALIFGLFVGSGFIFYAQSVGLIHFGLHVPSNLDSGDKQPHKTRPKSHEQIPKQNPTAPIVTVGKLMEDAEER